MTMKAPSSATCSAPWSARRRRLHGQRDRRRTAYALAENEVGETSSWTDPDSGERYYVTPTDTYSRGDTPCSQFVIEREIAGDEHESTETACRQADGSWRIVS